MDNKINKFIVHIVNNLFSLNEYSEGEIKKLIQKFQEEADDLNITISDSQLKKFIELFDQLKNSPNITEKELRKWPIAKFIKLMTSYEAGEEKDESIDDSPDVIYHEGNIIIWNGSKEENCIKYGKGEKWCITKGSFAGYRYREDKGYPTFYLIKNENLSESDGLSFVAIQVRETNDESKKYVYTNRHNSPNESKPMDFNTLISEIPWLKDIPNLKSLLKLKQK